MHQALRGFWNRTGTICILTLGLILLVGTSGCGGKDGPEAHAQPSGGRGGHGGEAGGRRQAPPIPVSVAAASYGSISSYYHATASLEANNQAEILARVSGLTLELLCEEGDFVRKGQVLVRIEPAEYQLRLHQSEAEAAKQSTRYDRVKKLMDQQLVSAEDYEMAENDFRASEAAVELAKLELSYTQVAAPFSGRIVQRYVDIGRTVSTGTQLFLISDMQTLLARVHVPSKEFRNLQTDQAVELSLDSTRERLQGEISLVSPVIDPSTGTIKVTVQIDEYPENTRPGDFAEVSIVTDRHDNALLIPKVSVITDKGERITYVAQDSTAERRVVEVGFEDEKYAEILGGLQPGESVVIQGQRSLKHGSPIKVLDAMTYEERQAPSPAAEEKKGPGKGRGKRTK